MRTIPYLMLLLVAAGSLSGQITPGQPNLDVALVATNISSTGTSMAADSLGNVFILHDLGFPTAVGPYVSRVRPNGMVDLIHAVGFVETGQLQYNPQDGNVYMLHLTGGQTEILRVLPGGGTSLVLSRPMIARGMAIDDNGWFYLGASAGPSGPGVYLFDFQTAGPTFLGAGFGPSSLMLALSTGDVLIANGAEVRRFVSGAGGTTALYSLPPPQPNISQSILALARNPLNSTGKGLIVGQTFLDSSLQTGIAESLFLDPQGAGPVSIASETWSSAPTPTGTALGLRSVASGLRQDIYWFTAVGTGFIPEGSLWRIRQLPAPGVQGSYLATKTLTTVTLSCYGPPTGGDALILGMIPTGFVVSPLFLPSRGLLGLDPFHPGWFPIVDGIGIFTPPNPLGATSPGGAFQVSAQIPLLGIPITLDGQALILTGDAPNGVFMITNVDRITLP